MGWRLKRADHETLLKEALGKKRYLTILDGTAGFIRYPHFSGLGHKVIACEQSRIYLCY